MPGKPKKLTPEQIEKARRLVEDGVEIGNVARRFGVTTEDLNRYGIRRPVAVKKAKGAGA